MICYGEPEIEDRTVIPWGPVTHIGRGRWRDAIWQGDQSGYCETEKLIECSLHGEMPTPLFEDATQYILEGRREDTRHAVRLAIVIPTLYEGANIRELLRRITSSVGPIGIPYELIVVDDDSSDGIESTVLEISQTDPRIRLLIRKDARGLAGAIIHGWQNTDADVLGVIDADMQHPPELLPHLWQGLEGGADIAIGTRYLPTCSQLKRHSFRRLLSGLAIWLASPLQKPAIHVSDPMSGFFLVRRSCIQTLHLEPEGFKILLEILVRGNIQCVAEIPFRFGQRLRGKSKASPRVMIDYLSLLIKLWMRRLKAGD